MKLSCVALLGALATCLLVAAPAPAAWTDMVRLTEARGVDPRLAVGADGEAFVVWGHRGPAPAKGGEPVAYSTRAPGGAFTEPRPLAGNAGVIGPFASNGRGDVSVSWFADPAEPGGSPFHTVLRPAGSDVGPVATPPFRPQYSALDAAGNTTFAWVETDTRPEAERGDDRVVAATRFADGSAGPIREVAQQDHAIGASVGADASGRVVVAWLGRLEGEPRSAWRAYVAEAAPGAEFSAPRALSGPFQDTVGYPTRVVSNDRGDAAVMWPVSEPLPDGSTNFASLPEVSYRPAGGDFGPAERIPVELPKQYLTLGDDIEISPQGDVLVAWSGTTGATFALRPAGGRFEHALSIERPGPYLLNYEPRVAFDARGGAVAAWVRQEGTYDHRLVATMRPRGAASWGPVREIAAAKHIFTPRIAFDARGGGVAVWSHEQLYSGGSGRTEHGIDAAVFDPALPDIDRVKVASRAGRPAAVVVDVTKSTRVTIAVQRVAGKRVTRVGRMSAKAGRGRTRVRLTRALEARLARPGDYRFAVAVRGRDGIPGAPVRTTFRVAR
jgi:hypothetical protein